MKAYVYGANGAGITDVAKPAPKGTQVLVRVRACGLNRADLGMTKGHAHGSAGGVGTVLGMEWGGEIAEGGPKRADPGRQFRRRPDGDADRKAQGREDRDRVVDRSDAPRTPEGIRR